MEKNVEIVDIENMIDETESKSQNSNNNNNNEDINTN